MTKPRQGQKKPDGTTAIPKPLCENCGVILERLYVQKIKPSGKRGLIKWGWGCPVCGIGKKDKKEETN